MAVLNRKGLGKGLGVLIPTKPQAEPEVKHVENQQTKAENGVSELDINKIEPNSHQPRKYFDEESLHELAASIKEFGVIQPLIVKEENGYYKIIAGERRFRAARIARLKTIPVIIKDYTEQETLQVALIENIQRRDLNPIEEAQCYKRLHDDFFFSQEDIAEKVGKSRNTISALLSLLNLDEMLQTFIIEGKLSVGHGRLLLSVSENEIRLDYAEKIIDEELSVKEAEKGLAAFVAGYSKEEKKHEEVQKQTDAYAYLERDLKNIFGTKVNIRDGKNKGKIEIEYYGTDELDRIFKLIKSLG